MADLTLLALGAGLSVQVAESAVKVYGLGFRGLGFRDTGFRVSEFRVEISPA